MISATPVTTLGLEEIQQLLPHRPPFLWLDSVDILTVGRSARGIKEVSEREPVFGGHFPGQPVFPGVLIAEALAQTGGVLLAHARSLAAAGAASPATPFGFGVLTRVDMKFLRPVRPGHVLRLNVVQEAQAGNMLSFRCSAEVDGMRMAEGRLAVAMAAESARGLPESQHSYL